MFKKHHTTAFNFLLAIGTIVYLFFVFNHNLPMAMIAFILFLYVWIIGKSYYKSFDIYELLNKTGYFGALFAITFFFMFGIEEVPYPEGAIVFHPKEIALSLIVFIVSHIIVLYSKDWLSALREAEEENHENTISTAPTTNKVLVPRGNQAEGWEEATLEDLESGNFETV